jgi:hypothetical protein
MNQEKPPLSILPDTFAICRLPANAAIPAWAEAGGFCSITRTADELSITCPQRNVPDDILVERDWRCLKVIGPLDFALTGIVAALTAPLAAAGISVSVVATYDTDYLLVKADRLDAAVAALQAADYNFIG